MVRIVTDQRRADIYEQLLISEDKRVIDVDDLVALYNFAVLRNARIEKDWPEDVIDRVEALILGQPERTSD